MVIANRIIFVAIMDQTAFSKVECKNKKRKTSSKIFLERMGEDDSRDQLFNDLSNPATDHPYEVDSMRHFASLNLESLQCRIMNSHIGRRNSRYLRIIYRAKACFAAPL